MSSKAYDILQAVVTDIDTNKSVINTVQDEYKNLHELIQEANEVPGNFPKAIVIFGENELPVQADRQTIGKRVDYLLPIFIDIYTVKSSDLMLENENALKEVRDLIDNDKKWTANNFPTQYPIDPVQRATVFDTNNQIPSVVFGVTSLQFRVLYWFDRGQS